MSEGVDYLVQGIVLSEFKDPETDILYLTHHFYSAERKEEYDCVVNLISVPSAFKEASHCNIVCYSWLPEPVSRSNFVERILADIRSLAGTGKMTVIDEKYD